MGGMLRLDVPPPPKTLPLTPPDDGDTPPGNRSALPDRGDVALILLALGFKPPPAKWLAINPPMPPASDTSRLTIGSWPGSSPSVLAVSNE